MLSHVMIGYTTSDSGGESRDSRRRAADMRQDKVAPRKGANAWPACRMSNATS